MPYPYRIIKAIESSVRAQITNALNELALLVGGGISDTAYDASWNGSTDVAPSQNAVYDKIESITPNATHTGEVTGATALTVGKTAISNKTRVKAEPDDYLLITDTSDSDALKRSTVGSVSNAYRPAMMWYDGTTGFYSASYTSSGNKVSTVVNFVAPKDPGSGVVSVCVFRGAAAYQRTAIRLFGSTHATTALRNKIVFQVNDSTNTLTCQLASVSDINWGVSVYSILAAFDGDLGTAVFYGDYENIDDTGNASRVAPSTATLSTGTGTAYVGSSTAPIDQSARMTIGYLGHHDAYRTNYTDFMTTVGSPKEIDESSWTEWGSQPKFWNPHGQMENNMGSAGNMTKNGTIRVSSIRYGLNTGLV